jgi:hypothetical protein
VYSELGSFHRWKASTLSSPEGNASGSENQIVCELCR